MSEAPKKEEHVVRATYRSLTNTFSWKCSCGERGSEFNGPSDARLEGEEHVQELGVKPLGTAFVVREAAHGQDCKLCHQAARVAVRDLRKSGASETVGWTAEEPEYPGQEHGKTHWAKVARPNVSAEEQEND